MSKQSPFDRDMASMKARIKRRITRAVFAEEVEAGQMMFRPQLRIAGFARGATHGVGHIVFECGDRIAVRCNELVEVYTEDAAARLPQYV